MLVALKYVWNKYDFKPDDSLSDNKILDAPSNEVINTQTVKRVI